MPEYTIKQLVDLANGHVFIERKNENFLYLPKIQRNFVWSEDKICRLFDSVLRGYPISSMLFWRTEISILCRNFIKDYSDNILIEDTYIKNSNNSLVRKTIVLDGQQRIQSFYIGLMGSYEGKKLYIDILSGDKNSPDGLVYKLKFLKNEDAKFPYILFQDIVNQPTYKKDRMIAQEISKEQNLLQDDIDKIQDNIDTIRSSMNTYIPYVELDGITNNEAYTLDDIVEIFIRANSGGIQLSKSDLLFSLLVSGWDNADIKIAELIKKINRYGYKFSRDFILKTCLVLSDVGAEYKVEKFRNSATIKSLNDNWNKISKAIKAVTDFIHDNTYIKTDDALTSYLALIPLIYIYYKYPDMWNSSKDKGSYIIKALLSGTFGGHSDSILNAIIAKINKDKRFVAEEIFDTIKNMGHSVNISSHRIFEQMGYGSKYIYLIMDILYNGVNYMPALEENLPQIDHIFPRSAMKQIKIINPKTNHKVQKYEASYINQLANCMVLTQTENGCGGKGSILPELWFANKPIEYLELHCIPKNKELWKIDNFEKFLEERKILLLEKLKPYVYKEQNDSK